MVISVNLHEKQIEKLKNSAKRSDQSCSRIIRQAVDEHFNKPAMELIQEDAEGGSYMLMKGGKEHE